jgi:hypothetical protein
MPQSSFCRYRDDSWAMLYIHNCGFYSFKVCYFAFRRICCFNSKGKPKKLVNSLIFCSLFIHEWLRLQ